MNESDFTVTYNDERDRLQVGVFKEATLEDWADAVDDLEAKADRTAESDAGEGLFDDAADPDDFDIEVAECELNQSGAAVARGTITNTSDSHRRFDIEVEFVQDSSVEAEGHVRVTGLKADQSATWSVEGTVATGTAVRCSVVAVLTNP